MVRPNYANTDMPYAVIDPRSGYTNFAVEHINPPHPDRDIALGRATIRALQGGRTVLYEFGKRDDSSGMTVMYANGFMGAPATMTTRDEAAEIALALRDNDNRLPSVVVAAGSGTQLGRYDRSSTARVADDFVANPDVASAARDTDEIITLGHSFGGRWMPYAIAEAEWSGKISNIIESDPPGVGRSLGMVGLAAAQIQEAYHLEQYLKHSRDAAAREHWGQPALPFTQAPWAVLANHVLDMAYDDSKGQSYAAMLDAVRGNQGVRLTTVSPLLSKMNDPVRYYEFVQQLASAPACDAVDFRHIAVDGATHNAHIGFPSYFGMIVRVATDTERYITGRSRRRL